VQTAINLEVSPDCFGRADTHAEAYAGRPDYYHQPSSPRAGRSAMLLELTLVDNRTGVILWHARQRFRADPARAGQVQRAVATMLKSVPAIGPAR
jgi:hypothetical protein